MCKSSLLLVSITTLFLIDFASGQRRSSFHALCVSHSTVGRCDVVCLIPTLSFFAKNQSTFSMEIALSSLFDLLPLRKSRFGALFGLFSGFGEDEAFLEV